MARARRPEETASDGGCEALGLVRLSLWLGCLLLGVGLFHALGEGALAAPPLDAEGLRAWALDRGGLVVVVALLRLLVLALAWYLIGVTAIGTVARLLRSARLVAVADAVTLPVVRRLLHTTLGVSLAASMAVLAVSTPGSRPVGTERVALAATDGGDLADARPDGPAIIRLVPANDHDRERQLRLAPADPASDPEGDLELGSGGSGTSGEVPAPSGRRPAEGGGARTDGGGRFGSGPAEVNGIDAAEPGSSLPSGTPEGGPAGEQVGPGEPDVANLPGTPQGAGLNTHLVRAGESLWTIARDGLAEWLDADPDDAQVATYWLRVIDHNRAVLADPDNPDLIFPGQRFELPDVDPSSERWARR